VLASALMLFVELALIRWSGSNIVHLSYFSNFVLLGSFLGIGLGFLRAGRARVLPFYSPIALAAFVSFVSANPVTVDRGATTAWCSSPACPPRDLRPGRSCRSCSSPPR